MDMTRFEDENDSGFKAVAGELRRWVKQLIAPGDAKNTKRSRCSHSRQILA